MAARHHMDAESSMAAHLHRFSQPPLQHTATSALPPSNTMEERRSGDGALDTFHQQHLLSQHLQHLQLQQQQHQQQHPQHTQSQETQGLSGGVQQGRLLDSHASGRGTPLGAGPQSATRQGAGLTLQQRFVAAAGASVVSALVVNPLDVVKTRIQANGFNGSASLAAASAPHSLLDKWGFVSCHPPECRVCGPRTGASDAVCRAAAAESSLSPFALMRRIAHTEGAAALWRGTSASLLMAVPMVGIYLPLYDALEERMSAGPAGAYAPLAAGAAARTLAVLCTSPLELVRTRMQAALHLPEAGAVQAGGATAANGATSATAAARGMWAHVPEVRSAGVGGRVAALWTGVGATLARDVPFSAIYWQLLEPIRSALLPGAGAPPPPRSQVVGANFVAGSAAGAIAAAVTTPLDVVKTRAQLAAGGVPDAAAVTGSITASGNSIADRISSSGRSSSSSSSSSSNSGSISHHSSSSKICSSGNGSSSGSHASSGGSVGGSGTGSAAGSPSLGGSRGVNRSGGTGGNGTIIASLRGIYAEGGVSALFSGVGPRALRAAPACAIVVASYEAIKALQSEESPL